MVATGAEVVVLGTAGAAAVVLGGVVVACPLPHAAATIDSSRSMLVPSHSILFFKADLLFHEPLSRNYYNRNNAARVWQIRRYANQGSDTTFSPCGVPRTTRGASNEIHRMLAAEYSSGQELCQRYEQTEVERRASSRRPPLQNERGALLLSIHPVFVGEVDHRLQIGGLDLIG